MTAALLTIGRKVVRPLWGDPASSHIRPSAAGRGYVLISAGRRQVIEMCVRYSAIKLTRALPQTGQLRMVSIPGNSQLNDRLNPQRHTCQWPTRLPPAALAEVLLDVAGMRPDLGLCCRWLVTPNQAVMLICAQRLKPVAPVGQHYLL